jgi:HD domain
MRSTTEFGSVRHLADRFFGALSSAGPPVDDERWALDQLLPGERELWRRMSGPDRRHAIGVAREVARLLEDADLPLDRPVVAAALLHDVGKVESQLGTFARVGATLAGLVGGRERVARSAVRPPESRWGNGTRLYLAHDRLGGELLRSAGSDPFTVAWAEEHHLPEGRWTVDSRLGEILKAADRS